MKKFKNKSPNQERWIFENPKAFESIQKGLEDAKKNRLYPMDSTEFND